MVDCGRGLNRIATVAGSGSFLASPWVESWPFLSVRDESGVNRGITDIPNHLSLENKCKRKAMNRNWCNRKANPALKTKAGNK